MRVRDAMSSIPGAWSEGEFGTLLQQTAKLLNTQEVLFQAFTTLDGTEAAVYRFDVSFWPIAPGTWKWVLIRTGQSTTPERYDDWLDGELKKLDAALPWCEKYGLSVVVDLHSPPGGKRTIGGYVGRTGGLF